MCLHFLDDTYYIYIYICRHHTHTRSYVHKKTKRPEEFEPVIDKPAELLLCFYSRVTWWRETLWLEGRKTFTITWHHRIYPFEAQWFVAFPRYFFFFFSSTFLQRTFIYPSLDIRKRFIFKTIELSLAAKFKGVESHFCFPPCLTPFSTTPAVPLSHSSNLSPSSPFLSSRLEGDADHWKKALPVRGERRGTHIHASGKRKHYIYIYIRSQLCIITATKKSTKTTI